MQGDDRAARAAGSGRRRTRPAEQRGELLGRREPAHGRGQVGVGGAAREQPARAAARSGRTRARRTGAAAPRGRVISRIASRPPGRSTRRSSRSAELEVGDVADRRSRSSPRRSSRPRTAARAGRPRPTRSPAPCAAPARASAARSRARRRSPRPARSVGDGEIAGAARGVEHAVAGPDGRRGGEPAPAQVEPGRHHPVHRVVDRRDAVEHRPDGVRRSVMHPSRVAPVPRRARHDSLCASGAQGRRACHFGPFDASRNAASARGSSAPCVAKLGIGLPLVHARGALQMGDLEVDALVLRALGGQVGRAEVARAGAEVGVAVEAADLGEELRPRDRLRVVLRSPAPSPSSAPCVELRAERLLRGRALPGEDRPSRGSTSTAATIATGRRSGRRSARRSMNGSAISRISSRSSGCRPCRGSPTSGHLKIRSR